MELKDVLYQMMAENREASQPADLRVGTVTAVGPLEITINTSMAPLRAGILLLTASVVEKKIPVLQHNHTNPEGGNTGDALLQSEIVCQENGQPLPVEGPAGRGHGPASSGAKRAEIYRSAQGV